MCGFRCLDVRRLRPFLRSRSYVLVIFFSIVCSFCLLLFLSNTLGGLDVHNHTFHGWNSSLAIRQRSCYDCFHAEYPTLLNQPNACALYQKQEKVDIIFFIFTPPDGEETRAVIRNTWASVTRNNTSNFRHVFVTGYTLDSERMRRLGEESRLFRDLVVSGFLDSYNNLTLKTITSLTWITRYCSHARFFFKVDDDVWINTRRLLEKFNESENRLRKGIGGYCMMSAKVIRDSSSKWYASFEAYPEDRYPSYCSGVSYGATLTVARKILSIYRNVPFFFLEDVYVGMCLRELELSTVHFQELSAERVWDLCEAFSDRVMSYHRVWPSLMTMIWNLRSCGSGILWRFLYMEFVLT